MLGQTNNFMLATKLNYSFSIYFSTADSLTFNAVFEDTKCASWTVMLNISLLMSAVQKAKQTGHPKSAVATYAN